MNDYMQEHCVRELARRLFVDNNRASGALYPDGFGFLSPAMQKPWLDKAREQISATSAAAPSKFVTDINARLTIIAKMIPNAKTSERRALQKERSDLEEKLRKVTS